MFVPSVADAGAVLVTPRSAEVATVLVAATVLLAGTGSAVDELTEAVFVILEPPCAPALTFTTSVNGATTGANDELPHLTGPAAPTAGVAQIQPAADSRALNGGPPGQGAASVGFSRGAGAVVATPRV